VGITSHAFSIWVNMHNESIRQGNEAIENSKKALLTKIPVQGVDDFKSKLVIAVKELMEYDIIVNEDQLSKESITSLIKIINTKIKNIRFVNATFKVDLVSSRKRYLEILTTKHEYLRHRQHSNFIYSNSVELAYELTLHETTNSSSYRFGGYHSIVSAEAHITHNYVNLTMEMKKNDMLLKILKVLRNRLTYTVCKFC